METRTMILALVSFGLLVAGTVSSVAAELSQGIGATEVPDHNTVLNLAILAFLGWIRRDQMKEKKAAEPERSGFREILMERLEKMAYGVDKTSDELSKHRIEFAGFASETRTKIGNLEQRLERHERDSGESPAAHG